MALNRQMCILAMVASVLSGCSGQHSDECPSRIEALVDSTRRGVQSTIGPTDTAGSGWGERSISSTAVVDSAVYECVQVELKDKGTKQLVYFVTAHLRHENAEYAQFALRASFLSKNKTVLWTESLSPDWNKQLKPKGDKSDGIASATVTLPKEVGLKVRYISIGWKYD